MKNFIFFLAIFLVSHSALAEPMHGIAMHGEVKHGVDFTHFSYANPKAPKGGRIILSSLGSFDSLNPLIVKGVPAVGLRDYVFESLMARAYDEPFSLYGLIAETIETPADRSWVAFKLRKEATFSDGKPVTVDDVLFSHSLLRDKGRPNHRFYYSKVTKAEKIDERTVKFTFKPDGDREMPLIMGLMPILPAHAFSRETFEETSLKPPVGSGPYLVTKVEPGARVTYHRNPKYWGWHIAANQGRFNFDEIRYDYYRDSNTIFEAFKKGLYHLRGESDPGRWSLGYKFPAALDGRVIKEEYEIATPAGMSALVFNTRKSFFSDIKVRKALALLLDFEWLNKNLYHGRYARTQSYFDRSELSSHGRPADTYERKLLKTFPNSVEPDILEGRHKMPQSRGSGRNRANRRKALSLLKQAGYALKDGTLVNAKTGRPFSFEILYAIRSQERLLLSYARALKTIGIVANLRLVDSAQYQQRKENYDFDMIQNIWYASLSPGNEQSFRWSSTAADTQATYNFPGIKNPAVDAMIQAVLSAHDRESFVSAVRALDRVLLSGHYVIALFHLPKQWVARWRHLQHPSRSSLYGFRLDAWWAK